MTKRFQCPHCKATGKGAHLLQEFAVRIKGSDGISNPVGWVCMEDGGCCSTFQAAFEVDLDRKQGLTVALRQNPEYQKRLPSDAEFWTRYTAGKKLAAEGIPQFSESYVLDAVDLIER